jgi:hypothetical protein
MSRKEKPTIGLPDLRSFAQEIRKILSTDDTVYSLIGIIDRLNYVEKAIDDRIAQYVMYPMDNLGGQKEIERLEFNKSQIQDAIPKLNQILSEAPNPASAAIPEEYKELLKNVASVLDYDPLQSPLFALASAGWGTNPEVEEAAITIPDIENIVNETDEVVPDNIDLLLTQTRERLIKSVFAVSDGLIFEEFLQELDSLATIEFSNTNPISPAFLHTILLPYLDAIIDIQKILNDVNGIENAPIFIKSISQGSINVELTGGKEAVDLVKETASKWRREHAKEMAELEQQSKQAEIEKKKAELREMYARSAKERGEAEKIAAEAMLLKEQAKKLQIENQRAELDLYRARFELALEMLNKFAPNMADADRLMYASRLLKPLEVITSSLLNPVSEHA